ncbi:hypothetical protein [Spiroplasma endosymbiont of Tricholauxania praeusta]|uniref:hypothetical protein n=1 Tax=Spiroplasma endosymbiont of Tricholauxania praeusta TaxID=3066296 RepID=UPI003BAF08FA
MINKILKLSKTSTLRNLLIQNINKNIINSNQKNYQIISMKLTELHENFYNLLNESSFNLLNKNDVINNNLELKANLEIFSINNIIDKLLKIQIINNETNNIIDEENYSHFMLRILLFNILKNSLNFSDKLRPTIILIDLPELYGTPKILFELNKWFNKLLAKNITLIIVSNSPEYLISLKPSLNSINLINNNHIITIENLSVIIKDAIILFSFWESNQRDLISYKNNLFSLIDEEDIQNEIKYIEENIFDLIIKSLFADEIILTIKKLNNISSEKYTVQHISSIRNLIFIYTILLSGFNVNSVWNSEGIDNFEKINSYFN